MILDWTAISAVSAAFLASLVEVVEALTIVLAVTFVRGVKPALIGTAAALALLGALVLIFGPLLNRVPIHVLQIVIGILLLLFGMRWLRKAVLRSLGHIALHDEDLAFTKETKGLAGEIAKQETRADWIAGLTAFKAVVLEGLEVVFIVIAVGGAGNGLLIPASIGAALACALVLLIGAFVHKPLSQVPENTLKFGVGIMLSAFGVFWTAEGLGVDWRVADFAIVPLAVGFLALGWACVQFFNTTNTARTGGVA